MPLPRLNYVFLSLVWLMGISATFGQSVASVRSSDQATIVTLEEYKVYDQQDGYKANTAITGTKTDTPLIDVPAPISVITKDVIDDLGALEITDLYPLMGSVTEFSYGGASLRGFRIATPDPTRYNGVAGAPYNDFGVAVLNNVEQVELLKGPVGLLYGDNEPGGMINIVTAKPKATFGGSAKFSVGSYKLRSGEAQVTGPIDSKKRFLYLFDAAYTDRDSFRNNWHEKVLTLVGSLTWVISDATRLNVEAEDITNKQPGARQRGVPFLTLTPTGTLAPNNTPGGRFFAPVSFSPTEPTDFQNLYTTVYSSRLDHAFSRHLRFNASVRYFESEARQAYHEGNLLIGPAFRLEQREFRHQLRLNDELAWTANLIGDHDLWLTRHKVLAGVEYSKVHRVSYSVQIPQTVVPPVDVLAPVYGRSSRDLYNTSLDGVVPNDTDKIRNGYYLQDQISIGAWRITGGLRYEYFDDLRRNPTSDEFSDSVITYRGAIGYKITPSLLAYYSYAMGLKPQTLGSEDQHGPFPPQKSGSHEVGVKWDLFQDHLSLTASVYDITKTNVLERDPTVGVPSNWLAPIGEVTSKGFDFDASGQITKAWSISANYAYNDCKVTNAGRFAPAIVGSRFPNAPRHKTGLWTRYNFSQPKIGVAGGFNYVSERLNQTGAQDFPGPQYIVYNTALFYRWQRMQFSLKCENVFDKVYSKSVLGGEGQFPGTPRNYTFTTSYRF